MLRGLFIFKYVAYCRQVVLKVVSHNKMPLFCKKIKKINKIKCCVCVKNILVIFFV